MVSPSRRRPIRDLSVGFLIIFAVICTDGLAETPTQATAEPSNFVNGHPGLGVGTTYQYDGTRGAYIGALAWTWDDDRYELAAFKFATAQLRDAISLGHPNWTFQVSRRWTVHRTGKPIYSWVLAPPIRVTKNLGPTGRRGSDQPKDAARDIASR